MDQSTHSNSSGGANAYSAGAAASQPDGSDLGAETRGDPRMNRAVQAKLNSPHISLSEALHIGGFEYPPKATASAVDNENVTLGQRKNQLNRRLRQARLNQAAVGERSTVGDHIAMGSGNSATGAEMGMGSHNSSVFPSFLPDNSYSAGSKRAYVAFSSSSSLTPQHDNKRQAFSSNNGYQDSAIQQSLVSSQSLVPVPSEGALASSANFSQTLERLSNPGTNGSAPATFQATAPSMHSCNNDSNGLAGMNQAPHLLEQLLHMQSLQQPPPDHMVQPQQQQQQLAVAASDLLQQQQQHQVQQQVANAASGLLQQQQQHAANAASDLLQQLAANFQQQQQQPLLQQQNLLVAQQQQQPQQQTILLGQQLGQQSTSVQPQYALTTTTQPVSLMGPTSQAINANGNNNNSNDLSQMFFYVPLQQQHQQQPIPLSLQPSTANGNNNNNNVAHSVTTSHNSTMSSRNSATSSAGSSTGEEQGGHVANSNSNSTSTNAITPIMVHNRGGLSLSSQGVVSSSTTHSTAIPSNPSANFKELGEDAAFLTAASLLQIPNGGEGDVEADGRLKAGLNVFESEIRELYQRSMIQAGYSVKDAQETSTEYHNFAFHAWKREFHTLQQILLQRPMASNGGNGGETLQQLLLQRPMTSNGGGSGAIQDNTADTRSMGMTNPSLNGAGPLRESAGETAANATVFSVLLPNSSNQQSANNNNNGKRDDGW